MIIHKENLTHSPITKYSNVQKQLLCKSLLVAGVGFLIIFGFGYLFYYLWSKNKISSDTLTIISVVSLFASIGTMLFFSFSAKRKSIPIMLLMYASYGLGISISFSSLLSIFDIWELLFIFSLAGLTMIVCGILGYILPEKAISSLMQISFIMMIVNFIFSLAFSLIVVFTATNWEWYNFLVIFISGFFSTSYTIYLFHTISRTEEFNAENVNKDSFVVFYFGFIILVSFVQLVLLFARILALVKD